MYVETDFLLALAKESDWLKPEAVKALEERDDLETSILPFVELMVISDRFEFDQRRAIANLLELVPIEPESDQQTVLKATKYQEECDATAFDAVNAAVAESRGEPILASDQIYDELDLDRVPLEPTGDE